MNIAVQAADLDAERIDGTRVYLLRLLERFGRLLPNDLFSLYHRQTFNPALTPPSFQNYDIRRVSSPFFWTQTRFSLELLRFRPDRVFMPVQSVPFFLPSKTQSVATIHDLAFKLFPEHFPAKDSRRLNWFAGMAMRKADRLIAVSESTKRDILRFYPNVSEERIRVVHHGYDAVPEVVGAEDKQILKQFNIQCEGYILYVGALQPRKNLVKLLRAFECVARDIPESALVLAGEPAWMSRGILDAVESHPFRERIVLTGRVSFEERSALYRNARIFTFPSLYEGFGLPVLEAFSAGIPVAAANNSSLPEVAGDAAVFFDAKNETALADAIFTLWHDEKKRAECVMRGREQLKKFSWDACAKETLEWIRG